MTYDHECVLQLESINQYYNALLASQLQEQTVYFEHKLVEIEEESACKMDVLKTQLSKAMRETEVDW